MLKYVEYIKKNKLGWVYTTKTFKEITTLKIGGKIKLLFYPNTVENFISFYKYYLNHKDLKLFIMGNGSNIFANSKEYNGIVVSFKKLNYKYSIINDVLDINSGVMINDAINYLVNNNYASFEHLYYIPATIGGMIKMNGGAYDTTISDNLISVNCVNTDGNIKVYNKEELDFAYRKSNINDNIILSAKFKLIKKEKKILKQLIENIKKERLSKQPLNLNNAGSTFKNGTNYRAWELIEKSGLRGYQVNDAIVSKKHTNFLVNVKNCDSDDMNRLINDVKLKVKNMFNVNLEIEWIFVNF